MSSKRIPPTMRRFLVPAVAMALAAVALIVFRDPFVAWFTGKPIGRSEGAAVTAQVGPFTVKAALSPDPPREKDQTLVLFVRDASGNAIEDATVDVVYDMPAMGAMAEMKGGARVTHEEGGKYRATFDLPMASSWTLRADLRTSSGAASQGFAMTVGAPGLTLAGSQAPAGEASSAAAPPGEINHYTCSMHPSVKKAGPGTCPICGMTLVAVTKEQQQQGVVMIDEARRQLIGVRTGPVVQAPMRESFRAVGRVAYDESALADVNLKVHGWITKLYVNETGQHVARGQTLFTIYSPELYNAEQDFLLATHGASASASSSEGAPSRTDSREPPANGSICSA